MSNEQARTLVPITADRQTLILERLTTIEEAIQGLVPLLEKIVAQLEAQTTKAPVPIASYDELYAAVEAGPAEGELVAAVRQRQAAQPLGWWARLFMTERAQHERR